MKATRAETLKGPAPWLEKERKSISQQAGRDSNRIQKAIEECGIVLSRRTDRIPNDLGDILEAFRHIELSINSLTSTRTKRRPKFAQALLEQVRNDLYIHLDYHFSGLRGPLDRLIEDLDQGAEGRGSRLRQVPEEQDSSRRRGRRPRSSGKRRRKQETFSSVLAWTKRKH